jgi:hypothetical protein
MAGAVSSTLAAIGMTIPMAKGTNPTKLENSNKLLPRLAQMLDGWQREDPPVIKKLHVEIDVPEYIATRSCHPHAPEIIQAVGDLCIIAFYYLLCIIEYMVKQLRQGSKMTVQFCVCRDILQNNSSNTSNMLH